MRRFLFGVVIASVTAAMPAWALGGDREIAQSVMAELQQHKAAGQLKGFDIDLKVEDGIIYLTGEVASDAQRAIVERAAINEVGRVNLVSELKVKGATPSVQVPVKSVPKPVAKVEAEPVAKPVAKVEAEPVAKAEAKPVAKVEAKPVAKVEAKPVAPAANQTARQTAKPVEEAEKTSLPRLLERFSIVRTASGTQQSSQPAMNDVSITDAIIAKLQDAKASGELRGFDLDISTVKGDVWVQGSVANQAQKDMVLDMARRVRGVARVIDDVVVTNSGQVRQVSTGAPAPVPQGSSMPVASMPPAPMPPAAMPPAATQPQMPQTFAPPATVSYGQGGYVSGGPVPMAAAGCAYGMGAPRYDQPNLPSYAWPSYAAHPNYAAVTYPKQYSPSAWPYIGPFYPYPQVPLGWRKVALEWDDGLWYLDFTSK